MSLRSRFSIKNRTKKYLAFPMFQYNSGGYHVTFRDKCIMTIHVFFLEMNPLHFLIMTAVAIVTQIWFEPATFLLWKINKSCKAAKYHRRVCTHLVLFQICAFVVIAFIFRDKAVCYSFISVFVELDPKAHCFL